jgi:3-methyladenine DNA glycosylase AlkC
MTLTTTLTMEQLLALPGEAVIHLTIAGKASPDFIRAAMDAESTGKCRWIVTNTLRNLLKKA